MLHLVHGKQYIEIEVLATKKIALSRINIKENLDPTSPEPHSDSDRCSLMAREDSRIYLNGKL